MPRVGGIHHVTAVAGDPQANLDFYAGTLGMRLVKRSVNQDDPSRYHLFFGDREGTPGTNVTFFPWSEGRRGQRGAGQVVEVHLAVPPGTLGAWADRLDEAEVDVDQATRFGEDRLRFRDTHGLTLALVEDEAADERAFTAWERSPVPEGEQVRGVHAVRVLERDAAPVLDLSREVLGLEDAAEDGPWTRLVGRDPACGALEVRQDPDASPARGGVGTVHHVAWRARDENELATVRAALVDHGLRPTDVIDRFWFQSVYAREPGGVLYELATDGPGFEADEDLDRLGERLVLPPWMEDDRAAIEDGLPPLEAPAPVTSG